MFYINVTWVELIPFGNEYIIRNAHDDKPINFQGSFKKALKYCEKSNFKILP